MEEHADLCRCRTSGAAGARRLPGTAVAHAGQAGTQVRPPPGLASSQPAGRSTPFSGCPSVPAPLPAAPLGFLASRQCWCFSGSKESRLQDSCALSPPASVSSVFSPSKPDCLCLKSVVHCFSLSLSFMSVSASYHSVRSFFPLSCYIICRMQ